MNSSITDFDDDDDSPFVGSPFGVGGAHDETPRMAFFNDSDDDNDSNGLNGNNSDVEEEDDGERIELETMEALFDDNTKREIEAFEKRLEDDDEEWLLCNADADPKADCARTQ